MALKDLIEKIKEWMPDWKKETDIQTRIGTSSENGGLTNLTDLKILEIKSDTPPISNLNFTDLLDVPSTYSGQGGLSVKVKATEDGLEFGTSGSGNRIANLVIYGSATSVAVGDGVYGLAIPGEIEGYLLSEATGAVHTKGVTGSMTIQVRRRRAGVNADMLNTKITLGDVFYNTTTDIVAASDDVSEGDLIFVDIDTIHTTAAKGLSVVLTFVAP